MQLRDPDVLVMRLSALTLSRQAHQREEGFALAQASKVQSMWGRHGIRSPRQLGTLYLQSGSREQ